MQSSWLQIKHRAELFHQNSFLSYSEEIPSTALPRKIVVLPVRVNTDLTSPNKTSLPLLRWEKGRDNREQWRGHPTEIKLRPVCRSWEQEQSPRPDDGAALGGSSETRAGVGLGEFSAEPFTLWQFWSYCPFQLLLAGFCFPVFGFS